MLVDDNPMFLRATAQFLEAHDDMVVVGTAERGDDALAQAEALRPQAVLIDLAMPGLPGLETIPRLRAMMPHVGIIALTVMNSQGFRQAALKAGADAFIPKATMRTNLLPAIRKIVHNGQRKAEKTETPPSDDLSTTPPRILIMEDDAHLRRLFSKALRAVGYEVHPAGTIDEAQDLLNRTRFDILICDIHMGQGRGTDLLNEHAAALATSGAQVIMVSGQAQYRAMCEEMGADFFLEKPVAISTLVELVTRLTAQHDHNPALV
jgi:DNA-binding response OmpR family regulator